MPLDQVAGVEDRWRRRSIHFDIGPTRNNATSGGGAVEARGRGPPPAGARRDRASLPAEREGATTPFRPPRPTGRRDGVLYKKHTCDHVIASTPPIANGHSAPPCGLRSSVRLMPLMYALWRLTTLPRSNHESSASIATQVRSATAKRSYPPTMW